jgi:hypothetical protein
MASDTSPWASDRRPPLLAASRVRRPRVEGAQPQHVGVLFERLDAGDAGLETAGGEVAQPAAGIQHGLAGRRHQRHFAARVFVRRHLRAGQHLDAVDLEGGGVPVRRHQLDQGRAEPRHRQEFLAVPVVQGAVLGLARVGIGLTLPLPALGAQHGGAGGAGEVERAGPFGGTGVAGADQGFGKGAGEQGAGVVGHGIGAAKLQGSRPGRREGVESYLRWAAGWFRGARS